MNDLLAGAAAAFSLGILTSVSPCPLATNIAAVSFVGRRITHPGGVLAGGLLYTAGRAIAYTLLGSALVASVLAMSAVSHVLETYLNRLLGPLLIIVGMVLLELLRFGGAGTAPPERLRRRLEAGGLWSAAILGFLFALSFCPISAALFFGSLIPLAIRHDSSIALPAVYGIATGVPVLAFALLLSAGARWVAASFAHLTAIEKWARRAAGIILIGVGVYLSLVYIFGVPI